MDTEIPIHLVTCDDLKHIRASKFLLDSGPAADPILSIVQSVQIKRASLETWKQGFQIILCSCTTLME